MEKFLKDMTAFWIVCHFLRMIQMLKIDYLLHRFYKQFKQKGLQYFLSSSLDSITNIVDLRQEPNKAKR